MSGFLKAHSQLALALTIAILSLAAPTTAKDNEVFGETIVTATLSRLREREADAYKRYETATTKEDIARIKTDLQSVIDDYEVLISQAPDYAQAFISYGILLQNVGEHNAGYAMFVKADEIDPYLPIVKNQLGNYMAEEGKYMEAYGFFTLARDLEPTESLYHYQIGNVLHSFRKLILDDKIFDEEQLDEQMQQSFLNAVLNEPGNLQYRIRYAQSFFDIRNPDWDTALKQWHEMIELAESDFDKQLILLYTARCRLEMNHTSAAKKLLKRIDHPNLQDSKAELKGLIAAKVKQ